MLGVTESLLIVIAGVFLAIQYFKPKKNLPPGPTGLPLLGNMLQMADRSHLKMAKWAKQYGKLFTIKLGNNTAVVVNDVKLAKEMLFDSDFTERPYMPLSELFTGGPYGIIFKNGTHWEEQRRWSLRKLRDFGFGKTAMEGVIMDEVNEVVEYFKKNEGKKTEIIYRFNIAALNSLWSLLRGKRMSQDDPKLRAMFQAFHDIVPVVSRSGLMFAPWIKHIIPSTYKVIEDAANGVMNFSREAVAEHFKAHEGGGSGDFISEYITEIKSTTDPSSSFYKETGRKNLEGLVSDLVQAGSETTSSTIVWAICYLSYFQQVQNKVQEELDSVLGSRAVTISDKPELPYTEAVILETLRYSSLTASGVQHCASVEKKVEGYTIPKDTWIMTNIYHIHHDPQVWGDPENFRPERFLSPDGKKVVKNDALIPFQLGRRQCLGESLARDSLFLFISTIFQKFHITKVEKGMPQPQNAMFLIPEKYHFLFKSRN